MRSKMRRAPAWLGLAGTLLLAVVLGPDAGVAQAQEVSPELLERASRQSGLSEEELLDRYRQREGGVSAADTVAAPGRTRLPAEPQVVLPLSDLEEAAEEQAREEDSASEQADGMFGEEFFEGDPSLFGAQSFGPVPGDYLLGPGDQIAVDVWGEVEFRHERVVDRDGTILLPKGGRITCANRTLEEVTQDIREQLSRSYSGIDPDGEGGTTFVEVNLGRLRAIRVFVVGEVSRPGGYELTSVSTIFTALFAAGGPGPQGSMREVHLMRGGTEVGTLDLYDYLTRGDRSGDEILRGGDTVFVPPRQTTVRITGGVRRPRTYELLSGEGVRDLIRYAGGFTADANTDLVHVERIVPPGERRSDQPDRVQRDLDLREKKKHLLLDGDVVRVDRIPERLVNWVEVQGNVKQPGRYEYREGATVVDLVRRAGGLWEDTVLERAVLDRIRPDGSFSSREIRLGAQMRGAVEALPLEPRDTLRIYSIWDLQDRFQVHISGEVRQPGSFDWREGLKLRDVVLKAGGLRESADILHAEVARLHGSAVRDRRIDVPPERTVDILHVELGADWLEDDEVFLLEPHDRIAIRRLPWWQLQRTVSLRGEVLYPGQYVLESPDERLSSVITRAGGLKPTAYAEGARLVREKDGIGNVALDLEKALEDPGSDQDAVLEQGDDILVPTQQNVVKVVGAVNYPTSIVWENGKGFGDYVGRAGGYADGADKWKSHVVYANGMSEGINRFWFDPDVKPGSTIVVPTKPPETGDSKLETLREISGILASVATVWLVIDRTD